MNSRVSVSALEQVKVLIFWNWQLNLRSWKTWKGLGKSHGKSCNLKSSKECEPCSKKTNTTTSPVESGNLYGDLLIRSILTVRDMENGVIKMGVDCLWCFVGCKSYTNHSVIQPSSENLSVFAVWILWLWNNEIWMYIYIVNRCWCWETSS